MINEVFKYDCVEFLIKNKIKNKFDLTFLDPPFNQNKEYKSHNDKMVAEKYWEWMHEVCQLIYDKTSEGGAIYFMQREKNTKEVMKVLEESKWTFQNLVIWKKKTSAVPGKNRYGKHYQIIVFATKGAKPKIFNKLRIDPPLLETEKYRRPNGMYLTDVWDDIRELTSGYFAGVEPLRFTDGKRKHKQQTPIKLLTRIILSSTKVGDFVYDPFAGTGTTCIVAKQLMRNSIGIEKDQDNYDYIIDRLNENRNADNIEKFRVEYTYTNNLNELWPPQEFTNTNNSSNISNQLKLFEKKENYNKSVKKL